MKKLISIIFVSVLSLSSYSLMAAGTSDGPPAQQQKDQVPDSTKNGNYLESQPDNNGATEATKKKGQSNPAKASNVEKGKKVKEKPENGGMNIND
jgi:hypothetical protein